MSKFVRNAQQTVESLQPYSLGKGDPFASIAPRRISRTEGPGRGTSPHAWHRGPICVELPLPACCAWLLYGPAVAERARRTANPAGQRRANLRSAEVRTRPVGMRVRRTYFRSDISVSRLGPSVRAWCRLLLYVGMCIGIRYVARAFVVPLF